jgi:hypothetical protein
MNEQMRHLIATLYQHSTLVPAVQVPSDVFRRMAEALLRQRPEAEDAKIINKEANEDSQHQ